MIDPERVFLDDMAHLDQLGDTEKYPELREVANIVHRLLLDRHRLIDLVKANHPEVKIRFRVSRDLVTDAEYLPGPDGKPEIQHPVWVNAMDSLDSVDVPSPKGASTVRLDGFLAKPAGMIDKRTVITVRDLISAVRNVGGGTHVGEAHSEKYQAVVALAELCQMARGEGPPPDEIPPDDWMPSLMITVRAIGRITRRGLEPLRQAVIELRP